MNRRGIFLRLSSKGDGWRRYAARQVLAAAVVTVCVLAAGRSGAQELTLDKALELARAHNPDLAAVADELQIARGELTRAGYLSPFNPQLLNEADYRRRTGSSNSQEWRVALSQEIEVFGQRKLRMESAGLGYKAKLAMVADQTRLLNGAVKLSFFDALRAREQLDLLGQRQELDGRLYQAARQRLRAGEIAYIDFNSAQIRYGETNRSMVEARERYRIQRSGLGRVLGGAMGAEPEPARPVVRPGPELKLATLMATAMEQRPDLKLHTLEIARLKTEAELNRRLALPNLTLGAFGGHELNSEYPMGVLLGFSIPIFNRRQGEAMMIEGELLRAKARLRAVTLNVERDVRDAYRQYLAAHEALKVYDEQVMDPARQTFELLERAFLSGKIDLLRLSVAEQEAFRARSSYIDAQFNLEAARVALELATGAQS